MKKFIFLMLMPFAVSAIYSQAWLDEFNAPNPNYYSIQKKFYDYMKDKDTTARGIGWKQFKRWEQHWKNRINPDGSIPSPLHYLNAINKIKNLKENIDKPQNSSWTSLGPTDSRGGYSGLGRLNMVKVHPTNPDRIFIGSGSGGLWYTTNGGVSWNTVTDFLPTLGVADIAFDTDNPNIIYMATGDADNNQAYSVGVLKSIDGGANWTTTGLTFTLGQTVVLNKILMKPGNNSTIFTCGSSGIYRSENSGQSWTRVASGNFKDLEFKPNNPNTLYACGSLIFRSTDGGTTWVQMTNGLPTTGVNRAALAVTGANPEFVYAIYSKSNNSFEGVYRSADGGSTWTKRASAPNLLGWAVDGKDGGGQGWYDLCLAASPSDSNTIFSGGINIWKSTDGGVNWELNSMWYRHQNIPEVHADQHDLYYAPDGSLYTGNDGGVYKTTDNGATWAWLGAGLVITQFYKFSNGVTDPNVIIAGSQDNGTKHKTNGTWRDQIGGDGMDCIVDPTDHNIVYASLYYGSFFKSTDGGNKWRRINDADSNNTYDHINETGNWITPIVLDPNNHNIVYVGMQNIWKSTDQGLSFTKLTSFTGGKLDMIEIAPSNSSIIYVCAANVIRKSIDGGNNWTNLTIPASGYVSDIEIHPTDPNKIWITYGGFTSSGKIYISSDGGGVWSDISSGLPAVPLNCVVYQKNANDMMFVGSDIGVSYKDASMSQWQMLGSDLPTVIVSDLEVVYSQNILRACTYGRGIWEKALDPPLEPPVLSAPDNAASFVQKESILFRWNPANKVDSYTFQLSKDAAFSSLIINQAGITNTSFAYSGNLEYNTVYYWRVKSHRGSNSSSYSSVWSFRTEIAPPSLLIPVNNATNVFPKYEFRWSSVNGADSYELQIASDASFLNKFKDLAGLSDSFVEVENLKNSFKYFWRVRASNTNGKSDWSAVFSFETQLMSPKLITPENNAKGTQLSVEFLWELIAGADKYIIQVSAAPDFATFILNDSLTLNTHTHSGLKSASKYWWRVKAVNSGSRSEWSEVSAFSTYINKPLPLSPEDKSYKIPLQTNLLWEKVEGSKGYIVQLAEDSLFTKLVINKSETSASVSGSLKHNATYYWRVKSFTDIDTTDWSNTYRFTTLLQTPELTKPADKLKDVPDSLEFAWITVSGGERYVMQASEDPNFTSILISDTSSSVSHFIKGLPTCKDLFLRLKAINDFNHSDWTKVLTATTKVDAPLQQSPAMNEGKVPLTAQLQLKAPECSNLYEVQVSYDNLFTNPFYSKSNLSALKINAPNLQYNKKYFWRVRGAKDNSISDWSQVFVFYTLLKQPELTYPDSVSAVEFKSLYLEWNHVETAELYDVEVSDDSLFLNIVCSAETGSYGHQAENLRPLTKYWWRVRAKNEFTESEWKTAIFMTKDVQSVFEAPQASFRAVIAPNPAQGDAQLQFELFENVDCSIDIYDMNGGFIYNIASGIRSEGSYKYTIKSSSMSSGSYNIVIRIDNRSYNMNFIIQK